MKGPVLVTSNPQKALEIQHALGQFNIAIAVADLDVPEVKDLDIAVVVRAKAEAAYQALRQPVIVDDTGIFFAGYKHFPGAYSKFAFKTLGFKGLFKLIQSGQKAYFSSFIGYKASANAEVKVFQGICRGHLITTLRGKRKPKMPYDNIFIPDGDTLTFSQMTVDGKQRYDHRSKAIRAFAHYWLKQRV